GADAGEGDGDPASSDGARRRRRRARRRRPPLPAAVDRGRPSAALLASAGRRRREEVLPFALPIWMARKLDRAGASLARRGRTALAGESTSASGSGSGLAARLWTSARRALLRRGAASYESLATASPTRRTRGAPPRSRRPSDDAAAADDDFEGGPRPSAPEADDGGNGYASPTEGLRRRSPSRGHEATSPSSASSHRSNRSGRSDHSGSPARSVPNLPSIVNSSSSSSSASLHLQPHRSSSLAGGEVPASQRVSSDGSRHGSPDRSGSGGGGGVRSPAQRAVDLQLSQHRRFSPRRRTRRSRRSSSEEDNEEFSVGSDDDATSGSSSSDDDDDDDSDDNGDDDVEDRIRRNETGCGQRNLYVIMRLSFFLAMWHVFVLAALHVTYVGPHAFRTSRWTPTSRGRSTLARAREPTGTAPQTPGYAARYEAPVNCLARALATRPVAERSGCFGEEEEDEDRDGGRSMRRFAAPYYPSSSSEEEDDEFFTSSEGYADDLGDLDDEEKEFVDELVNATFNFDGFHVDAGVGEKGEGWYVDPDDDPDYVADANEEEDEEAKGSRSKGAGSIGGGSRTGGRPRPADADAARGRRLAAEGGDGAARGAEGGDDDPYGVPLLGKDEILQIRILFGGKCTGQCSRAHKLRPPRSETGSAGGEAKRAEGAAAEGGGPHRALGYLRGRARRPKEEGSGNGGTTQLVKPTKERALEPWSEPSFWDEAHYRFAIDVTLLHVDESAARRHNVTIVNVTLTERCLRSRSDAGNPTFLTGLVEFLTPIYGMDSVIINQLMYGVRGPRGRWTSGHVKNLKTQERWTWRGEQLEAHEGGSFGERASRKFGVLLLSVLAFFLVTSVTSLVVRVLTSSGVVLMFPLFSCLRAAGMPGADERILALSYPWIGTARVAVARGGVHPQSHLVWAHVAKILLYYVMYEACQAGESRCARSHSLLV
ncbi:hypothetical protein ACHAWF_009770, partial [Thalassiosira exigua]